MQAVIFSMFLFQLPTLLCLKLQKPEWPQRSAQMKSFLLKVNKPPVNKVSDRKHTSGKDFSLTNQKLKYLTVVEQPETEIAETKSSPEVGEIDALQIFLLSFS